MVLAGLFISLKRDLYYSLSDTVGYDKVKCYFSKNLE